MLMHKTHSNGLILACESSCDETAWSIYDIYKKSIITNTIFSQIKKHASYGGVVPEIASQEHLIIISSLLKETLNNAKMKLSDIDYFACTTNPGLPGSLLIGCNYTKSLSWNYKKPFIGVNHLAGHIYSACIEHEVEFPFLCLSVSGGHTSLYYVISTTEYSCISSTRDDAAGELFDKIAKILKLEYPGGPIIEQLAKKQSFQDVYNYPRLNDKHGIVLSFSGLKTAILYDLIKRKYYDLEKKSITENITPDIIEKVASSLLIAVRDILLSRLKNALIMYPKTQSICFVGGVACNRYLQEAMKNTFSIPVYIPKAEYCTDNAAMIAKAASFLLEKEWSYSKGID